jgi:hypothetical protein
VPTLRERLGSRRGLYRRGRMGHRLRTLLVVVGLAAAAAGACGGHRCAAPASTSTAPPTTPTTTTATTTTTAATTAATPAPGGTTTTTGPNAIDEGLRPYVNLAVTDLAGRLGLPPSAVTPVSARIVTWSDASLGCPQPGMSYAQTPVDGAVIELTAGGDRFRYHSGGSTPPFLCDQPASPPSSKAP